MSKRTVKKNEISNILKLGCICIGFIIIVLLCRKLYLNNLEIEKNTPILEGILTHQIKANELYSFVDDNDNAIIYMCVSNDTICRNLEKKLKTFIQKHSLEDIIVYLDLNSAEDKMKFLEEIDKKYNYVKDIKEYPVIIYFENGTIKNAVSGKNVTQGNIEKMLKENNII